ncbi:uncharacterized protein LOC135131281 [Zophobas morio]|uniref:uncharacterized protein LOC135131281 n=1 Tax=Zophobas morio TaxID=2755281 RepID=UPI003082CE53
MHHLEGVGVECRNLCEKTITPIERGRMIGMHEASLPFREITRRLGPTDSTILRTSREWNNEELQMRRRGTSLGLVCGTLMDAYVFEGLEAKGEPLSIVKSLPISDGNYLIVYESLTNRYENKRLLVTTYWQSVNNANKATSDSPQSLRNLVNSFTENLAALDQISGSLNPPASLDLWDFTLFNWMLSKLDASTRKRFELENSGIDFPTFNSLKEFVLRQCKALEVNNASTGPMSQRANPVPKPLKLDTPHQRGVVPHAFVANTDSNKKVHTVRALLDSGSQASFITEKCQRQLGLGLIQSHTPIIGLNGIESKAGSMVSCIVQPYFRETPRLSVSAMVIKKIFEDMPVVNPPANRPHRFVIIGDIKQMYRQNLVVPHHRDYQRILWRFHPDEPIREFRLNTVTYGVASASFLALRTLAELANIGQDQFPLASRALSKHTYVDDIVTGTNSVADGQQLRTELETLLGSAGFHLHKWSSNCPELVPCNRDSHEDDTHTFDSESFQKILGLSWHAQKDSFSYIVKPLNRTCTKRTILSDLARIFDPLGFLAPLTFFAKCLIQNLWTLGLQWDDEPPEPIVDKWQKYSEELLLLTRLEIPRHLNSDSYSALPLHGFCDASESGFSGAAYFRYEMADGQIITKLVCAKTKVAPLKRVTLPRLELCGALLLAKLISRVCKTYQNCFKFQKIFAWSDSTVALSWIKSSPHRWKCFVANRVAQIQDLILPSSWKHIRSEQNPADCASRGLLPSELVHHSLWWAGPTWLQLPEIEWNLGDSNEPNQSLAVMTEKKKVVLNVVTSRDHIIDILLNRYSSLRSVQRVIAILIRFTRNARNKEQRVSGHLTAEELHRALLVVIQHVQASCFEDEIAKLRRNQQLSKALQRLNPFLDNRGFLRVGGRLQHPQLPFDAKHPLLLPSKHRLTELLIEQFHVRYLHVGHQTLFFLLRQQFWILSAKRAIRSVVSRCIRCFRTRPTSITPLMGNLPYARVNHLKPFLHSGVDFAGPISLTMGKYRGTRTTKAYICIFVCMSVKAVHLELVSDLTSDAFIGAFRRFIARRGRCTDLYSDCGTNFVGANKVLLQYAKNAASSLELKWHFNPPNAPNFGGLWEAGVRSVKTHIVRVIGAQSLTFEEYYTLLVQIEAVLNSRPLFSASPDPNDLNALTPGHFLVLEPLSSPPDEDVSTLKLNRLNRWQLIQRCQRDFWKRYQTEYLHTLQQRTKWCKVEQGPQINSVVVIRNDNAPPLQWRLGRIVELHPGADGVHRVATIKTSLGLLKRPISKLCPLPVES